MNLNELRDEAYSIAKANGWHDEEYSDEHYLMLIITEIAEAVQADRNEISPDIDGYKEFVEAHDETFTAYAFNHFIKGCVEEELADVVIRCLSFAGLRGWDLQCVQGNTSVNERISSLYSKMSFAEVAFGICKGIGVSEPCESIRGAIIDTMEYCVWKGIDLPFFIRTKMKYNRLRGYRHGGKKY